MIVDSEDGFATGVNLRNEKTKAPAIKNEIPSIAIAHPAPYKATKPPPIEVPIIIAIFPESIIEEFDS